MSRRTGRGRLSSIELLPHEAEPIVVWAMGELRARQHTQVDILEEFNKRLRKLAADMGSEIAPISLSAFNRHALRLATMARRLEETRTIANALTERLEPGDQDDLTVAVAETIKTLVFELLEAGVDKKGMPTIGTTGVMELSRALHAAASAQSVSSARRTKVEKEWAAKAAAAIDTVAKAKGLTADTVEAIKAQVLGVRKAA
ncbi:MAG: DUF3486 family protein [Bauldia sp.]